VRFVLAEDGMEPDDLLCSCNARSRTPLVGRAQWETNQPIPEEKVSKIGRMGQERPGAILARRTRTFKKCLFHARSKGQPRPPPLKRGWTNSYALARFMARPGESIAKQSEGRVGETYLPVGLQVRKLFSQSACARCDSLLA